MAVAKKESFEDKIKKLELIVSELESGDVDLDNASRAFDIKTTSGDVKIGYLNIETESTIKTVSGDVVVNSNEVNCYIDTDTTSGDIRVKKSDRKSDIVLKINTTSGDIRVN